MGGDISESRSEHPHRRRNGLLSRIAHHKETKMRKSMHRSRAHSRFSNKDSSSFPKRSNAFDNRSPIIRKIDSDSTPINEKAEFNTVLRQLSTDNERSEPRTGIIGESGETVASDYFPHLDQLTDQEAESLLRAYASLSTSEREVDESIFKTNTTQRVSSFDLEDLNSTFSQTTETLVSSALPRRKHAHGSSNGHSSHKEKLKNSIGQFIRHFGKLLGSSSSMNEHDMNISINIQNSQKNNDIHNDNIQETSQRHENEPVITLKVEMTL